MYLIQKQMYICIFSVSNNCFLKNSGFCACFDLPLSLFQVQVSAVCFFLAAETDTVLFIRPESNDSF